MKLTHKNLTLAGFSKRQKDIIDQMMANPAVRGGACIAPIVAESRPVARKRSPACQVSAPIEQAQPSTQGQ
ncbi:MAG: hypothetical protein ACPGSC_11150 [Granulosicoccaceae bacterium]